MTFTVGDYRVRPFNDCCWTLERRIVHKQSDRKPSHGDGEWREAPYYGHTLEQTLRELCGRLIKESDGDYNLTDIKTCCDAIARIIDDGVAAMTKEAMA